MNKLAKIIEGLGKDDLLKIKRDLLAGNVDRLVEMRLRKYSEMNFSEKQCPICGGEITEESYVLEFGASYLRRKAYFDAIDCLEFFIKNKLRKADTKNIDYEKENSNNNLNDNKNNNSKSSNLDDEFNFNSKYDNDEQ